MVQESEGGMKEGLYVHIEDAEKAAEVSGYINREKLKQRLKEAADIYVTENGHILRRAE